MNAPNDLIRASSRQFRNKGATPGANWKRRADEKSSGAGMIGARASGEVFKQIVVRTKLHYEMHSALGLYSRGLSIRRLGRMAEIMHARFPANTSCAPSGRGDHSATHTQGIVLLHSALGFTLAAFQAALWPYVPPCHHRRHQSIEDTHHRRHQSTRAAQRAARTQPRAERSDALGCLTPICLRPEGARES